MTASFSKFLNVQNVWRQDLLLSSMVFHVSCFQKHLLYNDNVLNQDVLVEFMNLHFFRMTQIVSWMSMNYKHGLGKMVPRKGQPGKMFLFLWSDSLLLFLRTKTFYKGGLMSRKGSWDDKTRPVTDGETRDGRFKNHQPWVDGVKTRAVKDWGHEAGRETSVEQGIR